MKEKVIQIAMGNPNNTLIFLLTNFGNVYLNDLSLKESEWNILSLPPQNSVDNSVEEGDK